MKKKVKYFKGFTLIEVLLVMGIFIILTVVGLNGFLSIRETFIARENVELIIQDIESTKLKAMNMESGKDATWVYGFGLDFTDANELSDRGDYKFFKWCSPIEEYGETFIYGGNIYAPTKNVLPNYFSEAYAKPFNNPADPFINFPVCNELHNYINGRIAICTPLLSDCAVGTTGIAKTNEVSTLLDRGENQLEVLGNNNVAGPTSYPNYIFFESLTGRAIIYNQDGNPQSYDFDSIGKVAFINNKFVPLDIVLHRKRSNKFDLITVYPNSGEVIHHVYDKTVTVNSTTYCTPPYNILKYFKVDKSCYERYGIEDEISSYRK